jgi:hypothetical protein
MPRRDDASADCGSGVRSSGTGYGLCLNRLQLAIVPKERSLMYSSATAQPTSATRQRSLLSSVASYGWHETQKLGKTICDVPTAKSIRSLSPDSPWLKRSGSCMARAFRRLLGAHHCQAFSRMVIASSCRTNSASANLPSLRYSFDLLARNTKMLLDNLGVTRAACAVTTLTEDLDDVPTLLQCRCDGGTG